MKTSVKLLMLLMAAALFMLAACSGGSAGGDTATISISLSGGSVEGRATVSIDQLRHVITLSGPTGKQTHTIMGAGTVKATVYPGRWNIDVEGYLSDGLYSVGSASADVKAGKNTNVSIEMTVVWADSAVGGGGRRQAANFIDFIDNSPTLTKVYGTPLFTNGIDPAHKGSGAITYSSSNPLVATVDPNTGEVDIHKVGSTDIIAVKAADSIYSNTQTQYELVVTKALLTVTADNEILAVFDPVPAYTYTPSGFAYSDTRSVLTGAPAFSCSYTNTSPTGSYPLAITQGTLNAENYDFSFVDGTVSVGLANQAALTVTTSVPLPVTYGSADFTIGTSGGSTGGTVTYATGSGTTNVISISGTTVSIGTAGTDTIIATMAGDSNYNPVNSAPLSVTVNKRNLNNASVSVGGTPQYSGSAQTPAPSVSDIGLITGSITASDYNVSYSSNTYPGTATVTITATSGGNYLGTQTGTFTIDPKPLTVAVSTTKTYDGGNSLGGTLTVTLGGKIGTEDVDYGTFSATYTSPNANTTTITISGLSLSGGDQGNYTIPATYLSPNTVTVTGGGITQATGGSVGPPSQSGTPTSDTITVGAVTPPTTPPGQTVEYGRSATPGGTISWQSTTTFSLLSPSTTYYFYARVAASTNFTVGPTSTTYTTIATAQPALSGTLIIGGDTWVDGTLTADTTSLNGTGTYSYEWHQVSATGTQVGGNSSSYMVDWSDLDYDVYLIVSCTGNTGNVQAHVKIERVGVYNATDFTDYIGSYGGLSLVLCSNLTLPPGWTPPNDDGNYFDGTFDGNGKTITMTINQPTTDYQGLFGYIGYGSVVKNLGVTGSVTGYYYVGGIAGTSEGTILNCYSMCTINGNSEAVGGIVGQNNLGTVRNCYSIGGSVTSGGVTAGGVVGQNEGGLVEYCYAYDDVTGPDEVGGVVGSTNVGPTRYCVALNTTINAWDASAIIGRVCSNASGTSNNYANSDMTVICPAGNTTIDSLTGKDGLGVPLLTIESTAWWTNNSGWNIVAPTAANETTPWKMNGAGNRPILWFE